MGLQDAIRKATEAAFTAIGDLVVTNATYHISGTFGWSPATGTLTETGGSDTTVSKLLLTGFKSEEIDGEKVLQNDEKALIAYNYLTTTPKETDYFTTSGIVREIQGVRWDPAKALWILHVRQDAP